MTPERMSFQMLPKNNPPMLTISMAEMNALEACVSALRKAKRDIDAEESDPDITLGIGLWAETEGYEWLRGVTLILARLDALRGETA
jgi:hypothetical protein